MNTVLENIKARHSVRTYTGQQVSEADLALILEAATYAPNGMHLETWHFTAIRNKDAGRAEALADRHIRKAMENLRNKQEEESEWQKST